MSIENGADALGQAVAAFGEDWLLPEEANHRVLNGLAAAIAAMRLAVSARGRPSRWRLVAEATERREAFASAHRVLSGSPRASVNVSREADALCRALVAARPGMRSGAVRLHLPDLWLDGATARRVLLVAAELVTNALRHAFARRPGELDIRISVVGTDAILVVADDGPGMAAASPSAGTGMGAPIVRELVTRVGGTISCDTGPRGTAWTVSIPLDLTAMARVRSGA